MGGIEKGMSKITSQLDLILSFLFFVANIINYNFISLVVRILKVQGIKEKTSIVKQNKNEI